MEGFLVVALITLIGYGAVRTIKGGLAEKIALGWMVGSVLFTFLLFWIGAFGTFALLYVVPVLIILKAVIARMPRHVPPFPGGTAKNVRTDLPKKWLSKLIPLLWFLIAIQLSYAIYSVLVLPTHYWDAFHFWHLKARFFMNERSLGLDAGPLWMLGGVKEHYPLHLPILKAFICAVAGGWSDSWALSTDVTGFIAFMIIAYRSVFVLYGPRAATVAVYLISSLPFVAIHLSAGYADMTVALYLAASAMYWERWRREGDKGHFILSSFLIAGAVWTKNDAMVLYYPLMLAAVFMVARWKGAAAYFAASFVFIFPWVLFKLLMGLEYSPNPEAGWLEFHPGAFFLFDDAFFKYGGFGIFWMLFLPLLFYRRKDVPSYALWVLSIGALAVVLAVFAFTPAYAYLENNMTFQRSLLQVFPLIAIASIARVCDLLAEKKGAF